MYSTCFFFFCSLLKKMILMTICKRYYIFEVSKHSSCVRCVIFHSVCHVCACVQIYICFFSFSRETFFTDGVRFITTHRKYLITYIFQITYTHAREHTHTHIRIHIESVFDWKRAREMKWDWWTSGFFQVENRRHKEMKRLKKKQ